MLTAVARRLTVALLGVGVLATGSLLTAVTVTPSSADECWQYIEVSPDVWDYVNVCEDDGNEGDEGDEGDTGGGEEEEPDCYLDRQDSFNYDHAYCDGELSCYIYSPPPSAEDEEDWPERPADVPDDWVYVNRACFTQPPEESLEVNEYDWIEPPEPAEPSWPDEARQAFGRLVAPTFELAFNPPRQSVVNVDTWYWAEGATAGEITGTSAAGLVAIATPDRFEVDPGDGSDTLSCDFSVAESDTCGHVYVRASVNGTAAVDGVPAYAARGRLVYSVRFELNGEVMEIDGVPTEFTTDWSETAVPVAEIQSVVQ